MLKEWTGYRVGDDFPTTVTARTWEEALSRMAHEWNERHLDDDVRQIALPTDFELLNVKLPRDST